MSIEHLKVSLEKYEMSGDWCVKLKEGTALEFERREFAGKTPKDAMREFLDYAESLGHNLQISKITALDEDEEAKVNAED